MQGSFLQGRKAPPKAPIQTPSQSAGIRTRALQSRALGKAGDKHVPSSYAERHSKGCSKDAIVMASARNSERINRSSSVFVLVISSFLIYIPPTSRNRNRWRMLSALAIVSIYNILVPVYQVLRAIYLFESIQCSHMTRLLSGTC
jgi:hypothetical protein